MTPNSRFPEEYPIPSLWFAFPLRTYIQQIKYFEVSYIISTFLLVLISHCTKYTISKFPPKSIYPPFSKFWILVKYTGTFSRTWYWALTKKFRCYWTILDYYILIGFSKMLLTSIWWDDVRIFSYLMNGLKDKDVLYIIILFKEAGQQVKWQHLNSCNWSY